MNLLYYILIALGLFCVTFGARKKAFTFIIGGLSCSAAVNISYFHYEIYPFEMFGLTPGLESIFFVLTFFGIILYAMKLSRKDAYILIASISMAMILANIYELVCRLVVYGYTSDVWYKFATITMTVICIAAVGAPTIELIRYTLHKKHANPHVVFIVAIIGSVLLNSFVNYALIPSTYLDGVDAFAHKLGSSFVGKGICLVIAIAFYFFNYLIDKKIKQNEEKKKEKGITQEQNN